MIDFCCLSIPKDALLSGIFSYLADDFLKAIAQ